MLNYAKIVFLLIFDHHISTERNTISEGMVPCVSQHPKRHTLCRRQTTLVSSCVCEHKVVHGGATKDRQIGAFLRNDVSVRFCRPMKK